MKFRSSILVLLFVAALAGPAAALSWTNLCENNTNHATEKPSYCQNVGKDAYNAIGGPGYRWGKITGVTYLPKGSLIGQPNQRSERDAYYYIIDTEYGTVIRMCSEILCR